MTIKEKVEQYLEENPEIAEMATGEAVAHLLSLPGLKSCNKATLRRNVQRYCQEKLSEDNREYWSRHDSVSDTYEIQAGKWKFEGLSGDEVHNLCSWYSNQGGRLTQAQVAREMFKVFKRQLTKKQVGCILKALGVQKASLPVAPHLITQGDPDDVVARIREAQEAAIETKLRASDADHWRKKYEELKTIHWNIEKMGDKIAESVSKGPTMHFPAMTFDSSLDPYCPVLFLTDWHVGESFSSPIGTYNKDVFQARVQKLFHEVSEWLRAYQRPIEHLYIAIGGDMVDGVLPMRAGHFIEQDIHEGEQVEIASQALSWFIEGLYRQVGSCSVWSVGGNHDRAGGAREHDPNRIVAQWLVQVTKAKLPREVQWHHAFRDTVITWKVMDTLVLLTHGDRSPSDARTLVGPYRRPDVKHYMVLTGHKHFIQILEDLDITWIQGPSLVGPDPYGTGRFGSGSRPSQCLIEVRKAGPRPALSFPLT